MYYSKTYYDLLDPRMESNMSHEIRDTQDLTVITNEAYNKRDEMDPQTSACQAYNVV